MSSKGIQKALLNQKIEFLQSEIEEYRKREETMKRMNESLMQAVQNYNPFQV